MTLPDGTQCQNLDDSVELLLNTLIPNNPQQTIDSRVGTVRNHSRVSENTLKDHVWIISPTRAHGLDGVTGRMLRVLWPILRHRLLHLVNNCIEKGNFLNMWKRTNVVPIRKGDGRDARIPKSYRPVSLLPVLAR